MQGAGRRAQGGEGRVAPAESRACCRSGKPPLWAQDTEQGGGRGGAGVQMGAKGAAALQTV